MKKTSLIFKPNTVIINRQLELSGTRVKDYEKRAYTHEIWSYRISAKASNNRSFCCALKLFGVFFNLHTLFMREVKALAGSCVHAGSSEPLPHADVIRTTISCADEFIVQRKCD